MLHTAVFEVDIENKQILFLNTGICKDSFVIKQFYSYEEFLNKFSKEKLHLDDREVFYQTFGLDSLFMAVSNQRVNMECDIRILTEDGGEYQWHTMNMMLPHNSDKAVGSIQNIHGRKIQDLEMQHQATHDPLTDLLNRSAFEKEVEAYLERKEGWGVYCLLDLDNFKKVNDTKGHAYGDIVLKQVARILEENVNEHVFVSRFGGDEFSIFFEGDKKESDIVPILKEILAQVKKMECSVLGVTASIGVAFFSEDQANTREKMEKCADVALYQVKDSGKDGFLIYQKEMGDDIHYIHKKHAQRQEKKTKENLQHWLKEHIWFYAPVGIVIFLTACIINFFGGSYMKNIQIIMNQDSYEYLYEIANQIRQNIKRNVEYNFAALDTFNGELEWMGETLLEEAEDVLDQEKDIYGYIEMGLIGSDGSWHSAGTHVSSEVLAPYLDRIFFEQEAFLSQMIQTDQGEYMLFFSSMLENERMIGGERILRIAAAVPTEKIDEIFALHTFDGQGFGHITRKDGEVVLCSNKPNCEFNGYDTRRILEESELDGNITIDNIFHDLEEGNSREVVQEYMGKKFLSIYTPLGIEDWYLFSFIPESIIEGRIETFYELTFVAFLTISLLLIGMIAMTVSLQLNRKKVAEIAYVDEVTGGATKRKFEMDVRRILQQQPGDYTMIYANVGRFKLINDRMGWQEADKILKMVYDIYHNDMGKNECSARLMADHFGILVHTQDVSLITRRIEFWNQEIERSSSQQDEKLGMKITYGLYWIDEPDLGVPLMLDRANLARRTIGVGYRMSGIAVYDQKLKQKMQLEKELEKRQEEALKDGEFKLYLQPKYRMENERIGGAEALVRWTTPDRGMIYPDQFIPLFEANGFITKVDLYIFEQTCKFLKRMEDQKIPPICISVNLSRIHLMDEGFLQEYLNIWEKYGIPAEQIEFELTESLFFDDIQLLNKVINDLHRHGFHVSMDDFGSGYSSLNILKGVSVDILKLDKELLDFSADNQKAKKIVTHIISLAKDLNMKIVAEGVESREQVDYLKELGCDFIQGYYYAKPEPEEKLLERIESEQEENK